MVPNQTALTPAQVAEHVLHRLHVVDVREPFETIGELGHISGAENVPLAQLPQAVASWPRDRAIVVVDRDGQLAPRAVMLLVELGFADVSSMQGGMVAWRALHLPVAYAPDATG